MSETIYLVFGSTGEYSDHRDWVVGAWRDKSTAENLVVTLTNAAANLDYRDYRRHDEQTKRMAELGDPHFQLDYTGTEYAVVEVELR